MPELPPEIWAIVPASGSGSRYSSQEDKLLAKLNGKPVLQHTIAALLAAPSISGIVIVSSSQNLETYQALMAAQYPNAPIQFTLGGASRRDSVYNGLQALPAHVDVAVIHDAARPLIRTDLIEQSIEQVRQGFSGAVVAIPIHDTIKQAQPNGDLKSLTIEATLDRSQLWRAQTPQVFNRRILMQAHEQVPADTPVTDDAQLLELANLGTIALVLGDERNLKITTPTDLFMAEAFLQAERAPLL